MPRYTPATKAKYALVDLGYSANYFTCMVAELKDGEVIELSPDQYTELIHGAVLLLNRIEAYPKATGDSGGFEGRWAELAKGTE